MDTIYYCYERATGLYGGSGTPQIDTDTHACTTVDLPHLLAGQTAVFDPAAGVWTVIDAPRPVP